MKLLNITKIVGISTIAVIMAGCGGGSSDTNSGSDGDDSSSGSIVYDTGVDTPSYYVDVEGQKLFYKFTNGCENYAFGRTQYIIYGDQSVQAEYIHKDKSYISECHVDEVFKKVKTSNGFIDATFFSYNDGVFFPSGRTFYDEATNIFYEVSDTKSSTQVLVEIINDGRKVRDDEGNEYLLETAYTPTKI